MRKKITLSAFLALSLLVSIQMSPCVWSMNAGVSRKVTEQRQADLDTIEAVNQIDGVHVDKSKFDGNEGDQGFDVGDLNPIKWVFKPVTDMQKRVIHLEKQMMRLEGPIAGLQKPMNGLRSDMVDVRDRMATMKTQLETVNGNMSSVDKRLSHVEAQLGKMYDPIVRLKEPVEDLSGPVVGVNKQLTTLKADLKELKQVVSLTSTLILFAIVAVGLMVCVGTPVAALFAYRYRKVIMERLGGKENARAIEKELPEAD
ncbi:MAG: hypothetical protein AB7W16_07045 [Candidatus Obscuribacterales bacterium]